MAGLSGGAATLLLLFVVIWLVVGRRTRAREAKAARRHHGGRPARDRSFWGLPSRDRSYTPGLILLGFSCIQLAQVILSSGSRLAVTAIMLSAIVAIGYAIRADIVSIGMGIIGVLSLVFGRLGAYGPELAASGSENAQFFALAALFVGALLVITIFVSPVRSAQRVIHAGRPSFWLSAGHAHPPGFLGGMALSTAGVLDLLGVILYPGNEATYQALLGRYIWLWALVVVAGAVIGFGLAVLPEFTLSGTGLVVAAGEVIYIANGSTSHRSAGLILVIAVVLVLVNRVASRFV